MKEGQRVGGLREPNPVPWWRSRRSSKGSAAGVEEIHPEMLKALDAVGLWWLMHLVGVGACGPANR